jgi:hypothetical protein
LITTHRCVSGVTARDNRVHRRIDLDQFFERFFSTYPARKSKIKNDGIEAFAGFEFFPINVHAFERGGRLPNFVAESRQSEFDQIANSVFVVDHKHPACSRHCRSEGSRRFNRHFLIERRRQINRERRTDVHFRFDRHQTVVVFDNRVSGGEAKSAAFWLGGEVGIENPFHVLCRYAHAFVADPDSNVISRREIRNSRSGGGRVTEVFGTDVQRSAVWHRLVGVNDKVRDDLTDLAGVDFGRREIGAECKLAPVVTAAQREANRVLN